jgi:hypothetical protein
VREPTGILEVLPGQLAIWIRSLLLQSCPRATLRILHVYVTEALQISWGVSLEPDTLVQIPAPTFTAVWCQAACFVSLCRFSSCAVRVVVIQDLRGLNE